MANDTLFRTKAPGIMNLLMADFALDVESAAAILGNLGHESGGFRSLQELAPTVPGSAGGYGWAQWTGSRRRSYEAYCERNGYDAASDTANYKYLWVELKGEYQAAITAVKNAAGLMAKVQAFELAFERAGIKHYESRLTWAQRALDAHQANPNGRLEIADAPGTAPAVPTKIEVLDPIRTASQPLDSSQLIAVFVALLHQVMALPQVRAVIEPLVTQMLGIKVGAPVAPPPPPPAPKVDPSRPGFLTSLAVLAGSLVGIDQGAIGGAFGMGQAPSLGGSLSIIGPILTGAISLFGGGVPIAGLLKGVIGGIATAAANKAKP